MIHTWSGREQEWIIDHGFRVDADGLLLIPAKAWYKLAGTGKSIREPNRRTITIPSDNGLCLLFENKHFKIER